MVQSVLIVEDNPHFCAAFAEAITSAEDMTLAGIAHDVADGLKLLLATKPDVLLVDIGLPSGSGIELIRYAERHVAQCECMVVTVFADDQLVIECIEAGATGYLLKDTHAVDIVQQIRLLLGGGSPISPAIARRLLLRIGAKSNSEITSVETATLSVQERAVLSMSSKGYNYDEIARLMNLSRHTIETYVKRIYRKLQVHSKAEAVYEARKMGLMDD